MADHRQTFISNTFIFRTIQELTFSLGKASCERQIEKYEEIQTETKGEFADFLIGILLEIK
jgi:hypothetical protein